MSEKPDSSFLLPLIESVAPAQIYVKKWVHEIRAGNPTFTPEETAAYATDRILRLYAKQGVATALPGIVPGVGTAAQIGVTLGALGVETGVFIRNAAWLVYATGEIHGFSDPEALRRDALFCLGLWSGALSFDQNLKLKTEAGEVVADLGDTFSSDVLMSLNLTIGSKLLMKYGAQRSAVSIGRLAPFGIGLAIGGGFNYLTMRGFSEQVSAYFEKKRGVKVERAA